MTWRSVLPILPGAIVLATTVLALSLAEAAVARATPDILVYAALLLAMLLAWRFHSTRLFSASLLLAGAFLLLQSSSSPLISVLLATFLPLGLALLTLPADRGFLLARLRNHLALAAAPVLLGAFFSAADPRRAVVLLHRPVIDAAYTSWSSLPQPAILMLLVALVVAFTRTALRRRAVEAGLAWTVLAAACALAAPSTSPLQPVWMLAAALVLTVAAIEAAHALAFYDELTELPGRRALAQMLQALRAPYAIAVVDIDHFKSFNDQYGHDVGDQVLRMVAARLRRVAAGTAFRSGGEEFTIVFPGLNKREAFAHSEVVRAAVAEARFTLRKLPRPRGKRAQEKRGRAVKGQSLNVTLSVGVAGPTARYPTVEAVVKQADKALYRAKHAGRNCVV